MDGASLPPSGVRRAALPTVFQPPARPQSKEDAPRSDWGSSVSRQPMQSQTEKTKEGVRRGSKTQESGTAEATQDPGPQPPALKGVTRQPGVSRTKEIIHSAFITFLLVWNYLQNPKYQLTFVQKLLFTIKTKHQNRYKYYKIGSKG